MRVAVVILFILTNLLTGCGTNKTYHITSTPPGAAVGSGDVFYGTTPFTTNLNAILPHRAWDGKPWATRILTFTKEGYLPGSAVISEFGEGGTVHVDLREEEPDAESAEGRLTRLERMRDQGLITQEEYDAKRNEILGEL